MLKFVVLIPVLLSHGLYSLRFLRQLWLGHIPRSIDFMGPAFILYFDVGLVAEASSLVEYYNPTLPSFFGNDPEVVVAGSVLMTLAPWLMRFFADRIPQPAASINVGPSRLKSSRSVAFYSISTAVCFACCYLASHYVTSTSNMALSKQAVLEGLGAGALLLYFPLFLLVYYVRQLNSKSKAGCLFVFLLVAASIISAQPLGLRTLQLLPVAVLLLFYFRPSFTRIAVGGAVAVLMGVLMIPHFKWGNSEAGGDSSIAQYAIYGDFYRANSLGACLSSAPLAGTKVLPYPGAGYVFGALFFIPRALVPFKDASTARYFTSSLTNMAARDLTWGVGISPLEELVLNFGIVGVPFIAIYGLAFGYLDRVGAYVPSVMIPSRLSAIWIVGYHLAASELMFVPMFLVAFLLERLFTERAHVKK